MKSFLAGYLGMKTQERIAVNVLDKSDGKIKIWEMSRETFEKYFMPKPKKWHVQLWHWLRGKVRKLWNILTSAQNAAERT